jgi:hypothetical protein
MSIAVRDEPQSCDFHVQTLLDRKTKLFADSVTPAVAGKRFF